jgi:hypothetical protein
MVKRLEATYYKQKNSFWAFGAAGSPEIGGKDVRIRKPLGTDAESVAKERVRRILSACEEGAASLSWPKLRSELPANTFAFFAAMVGYKDDAPAVIAPVEPTWAD